MAEALSLAVNIATVVDLFSKVCIQCSRYCTDVKTAPTDVRYINNEGARFAATLRDVEKLLIGPHRDRLDASQNIRQNIEDCQQHLIALSSRIGDGSAAGWNSLTWPLKKGEVDDIIKKLERCRMAISTELQVKQTHLTQDIRQELILAKLRIAEDAAFDCHDDADGVRCLPGTRVDILRQIQEWGAARDSPSVFWLNGRAGTGKSTISRTVAQSWADQRMLGASFFFKRGEGDRSRARTFFPTIAAQLVRIVPLLAPYVRDEIESDPALYGKAEKEQFDKLIANPIRRLSTSIMPSSNIVIVVDALDECDSQQELLIKLLSQVKEFPSISLKVFITSRPNLPPRLGFTDISGKYKDLVLHEVAKSAIRDDITLFLNHELNGFRHHYNKSVSAHRHLSTDWPGVDAIQKLVNRAIPLFIFAKTMCLFIQKRGLGDPADRLTRILDRQESSQSSIEETYKPVLDQLLVRLTPSEAREVTQSFRTVVGTIVILADPLSTSSLAQLLQVPSESIEELLDHLHSVLNIPSDPDTTVRLFHLSFRDFLLDYDKATNKERYPFSVDERETHELLAVRCLQLLSTSNTLRRDVCDLRQPGIHRSKIDQQAVVAGLPSVVQYACRYWVYHWKMSERNVQDDDLVHQFFANELLHWLEALSIIGEIAESISMVDTLLGSLKPRKSGNISALLHDLQRILWRDCAMLDEFPLQVYYSTLVFAPKRSIVREAFSGEIYQTFCMMPGVAQDWDACLATLGGHNNSVSSLAFSHDSMRLASGSSDGTVKLWDPETGSCTATLEGHNRLVHSVLYLHDSTRLITACDETLKLWDMATGLLLATSAQHKQSLFLAAISNDSACLATVHYNTVKLWDTTTLFCKTNLNKLREDVISMTFSNDSRRLAVLYKDGRLQTWDISPDSYAMIGSSTIPFELGPVYSYATAFSPDSTTLAVGTIDGTIGLWGISTNSEVPHVSYAAILTGHSQGICSVVFSHDSKRLASASQDQTIKLWAITPGSSAPKGSCMATIGSPIGLICPITFSPDSTRLASACPAGRTIKLWDTAIGSHSASLQVSHKTPDRRDNLVGFMTLSHDSTRLASVSGVKTIKIWDMTTGCCVATLQGHSKDVMSLDFSKDSIKLVSASFDHTIKVWDMITYSCIATLKCETKLATFSHDSTKIISVSVYRTVELWDMATSTCIATSKGHNNLESIEFSRDSNRLAAGLSDGKIVLCDTTPGFETVTLQGHDNSVISMDFFDTSTRLVSASDDGTIKLWDTSVGSCMATLPIVAKSVRFGPDDASLHTNIGVFSLDIGSLFSNPISNGDLVRFSRRGIGLDSDKAWIMWDSQPMLWLPIAYRYRVSAVGGSVAAIAHASGGISFIELCSAYDSSADSSKEHLLK